MSGGMGAWGQGEKEICVRDEGKKKIDCGPGGGRKLCVAEGEETN